MGLLGDNETKKEESGDTLKVLATNIETINQRLAMTSPEFGFAEYQEAVKKGLENIWNQIGNVTNMIKTSEMELRQLINYSLSQNESLQKEVKNNSIQVKQYLNDQKKELMDGMNSTSEDIQNSLSKYGLVVTKLSQDVDEFKKDVNRRMSLLNQNVQRSIQTSGSTSTNLQNQLDRMKGDMQSLMKDFNKGMTEKIKTGENVDPSVIKEMKTLKSSMKDLFSEFSNQVKAPDHAPAEAHPQVLEEIESLKKEIDEKFGTITEVLRDLVDTNREYVHYLKE